MVEVPATEKDWVISCPKEVGCHGGVATGTTTRKPRTCGMSRRSCTQEKPNRLVFWNVSGAPQTYQKWTEIDYIYMRVFPFWWSLYNIHFMSHATEEGPLAKPGRVGLREPSEGIFFKSEPFHSVLSWTVIAWHPTASWIQARFRRIQFAERGQPVLFVCEELPQRGEHGQVRDPLQGFEAHTTGHVLSKMLTTERSSQGSVVPRFHLVARSGVQNGIERRLPSQMHQLFREFMSSSRTRTILRHVTHSQLPAFALFQPGFIMLPDFARPTSKICETT